MTTFRKLESFDVSTNDADLQATPPQVNLGPVTATLFIGMDSAGAFWANGARIGPAGAGGLNFSDAEVPSGAINGNNVTFTIVHIPNPSASLQLFRNGILQKAGGNDYVLSGSTITFTNAPGTGDSLIASYRF